MQTRLVLLLLALTPLVLAKKFKEEEKPAWAKKDIRDYSEADLERLLDQWEEDEEPLEDDELPEHLRPQPKLDLSNLDSKSPEDLLKVSKKGRTLMTFVSVTGNPTREESDTITKLWQTSLWNNHIQAERYMVDDNRAIFLFKDGTQAWDAKDFLIEQERCKGVTIENKEYPGVNAKKDEL
uniref:LDLR chaperone boca n=1 Tax=Drosophila melanogaster TaxID=7227 RepID=MESD_DROME|nr:boca [Drosophila melanogaster]Q8T9B6.2 RecName: Full=LDLR chaperone boca; Flags: Precursor [Drosophila melanogaster]AAF59229.2 boca [Drosophila melanogaster]ACH92359.1 FI06486p [Drosophila melanogaster]|eukprot:NP_724578.1 boca [Drosophila melanogaster]